MLALRRETVLWCGGERLAAALNLDLSEQVRLVLSLDRTWTDLQASNSALPDPIRLRLQTNLRF